MGEAPGGRTAAWPPRPVNDSWIAACCLVRDLPLATLDTKDVEDLAEHDGSTLALR
jgi:predicted nucleic acid-binding protein